MNFKIGDRVRIKDNAFPASIFPDNNELCYSALNGAIGTVEYVGGHTRVKLDQPNPWPSENPSFPEKDLELYTEFQVGDRVVAASGNHGTIVESSTQLVKIDRGGTIRINKDQLSPEPEEKEYWISIPIQVVKGRSEEDALNTFWEMTENIDPVISERS